jgi:putative SOS response-associated peptidase YedK
MCYHYTVKASKKDLEVRFDASFQPETEFSPIYHANGFNHSPLPIITADKADTIQLYHWGLIPHFIKTKADAMKLSNQTLNAVGETVFEKPSFRSYIPKKRCLVLATGIYEWMHQGKEKYPHHIYLKDQKPFAFAGIYSHWTDPVSQEVFKTYSILTTEANPLMKRIHNSKERMPVILHPDLERKWLNQDLLPQEIKEIIMPYDDEQMEAHTISRLITSRDQNSNVPGVMEKFDYPELTFSC